MRSLPECVDGLPNLSGSEALIDRAIAEGRRGPAMQDASPLAWDRIRSACAIALHMHQPLVPAGGGELCTAPLIGNLQFMLEHPDVGDNHDAPAFLRCYGRMGEIVPRLLDEGFEPRVMLDYSGTLFHGLRLQGADETFDLLRRITLEPRYRRAVEWLGASWGHAVAPSTPPADFRLHVRAWQHHYAALFGFEALARVRGFSPAEMALPNHPDVAYEFVRTLRECGYEWVLVQEHSVEEPASGRSPGSPHVPHRLVCRSSSGATASIVALVKTQGSDGKLVAQMQPWYEARTLGRTTLGSRSVPPLVTQISDGENGGVMMNEFPPKYVEVVRAAKGGDVPLVNGSEYLDHLRSVGVTDADLPVLQPLHQGRIWSRMQPGDGPARLDAVIAELHREDDRFHVEGGSWTSERSWVRSYESVLRPMEAASAGFHEHVARTGLAPDDPRYRAALRALLASQTSCYRYWGEGTWTDYGRELCRRVHVALDEDG